MTTQPNNNSQSAKNAFFRVLRQIAYTKLFKKYTSGNFSYNKILANNLIFNDTCRVVARFKDYLIFDDNSEFLRRFYTEEESHPRLDRILTFYETYSKIFPNYMILKESKYLYRNIRKKQKMIDAVNEIKREEEENRKKMKQNKGKENKEPNELFTKKVKEEIKTFQENATFIKYKNNFDFDNEEKDNSISISIMNRIKFLENLDNNVLSPGANEIFGEKSNSMHESFVTNETNHSISGILNILNDNKIYIKDLPKLLEINNYSKNSQKLKNNNKKNGKNSKNNSRENKNTKNNDNKNDKKDKKTEIQSKEKNNKNISDSSNVINRNAKSNNNHPANRRFKKLSLPFSSTGAFFVNNTENNSNELNQCQNIIIPKGSTVININNNYFDQIASTTLPMGYYTNKNLKKVSEFKNNNNNLAIRKSNTNNYTKTSNNNIIQTTHETKYQQSKKEKIKKNKNTLNNNKRLHYKQISQDYLCQKNQNTEKEKCITKNDNDKKSKKEKVMKHGSFSPQPLITNGDMHKTISKKLQLTKNSLKNENIVYKNFLTEANEPNLITGNTKGNEEDEEEEYKEKEKLFFHIRDLIEKKKKEKISKLESELNPLLLYKKNKIKTKNENKNNSNLSNFSKYKTISNFNGDKNKRIKNCKSNYEEICYNNKNKELMYVTSETFLPKKKLEIIDNKKRKEKGKEKNKEKNKSQKSNRNLGFNMEIKEKKIKSKGKCDKNNNNNNNCFVNSKLNKDKNNILLRQISNNLENSKKFYNNINQDNNIIKTEENNKNNKRNKVLNQRKKQIIYNSSTEVPSKKSVKTQSHSSLLYKNPMSQLNTLLMSHKKEGEEYIGNNATTKFFYKGRIKNIKLGTNDLNLEILSHNINSSCNYNSINTLNHKIALTEQNKIDKNKDTLKELAKTQNFNNTDLRNKYRSYLNKKNKQKSCEIENHSAIQKKMNTELLERMVLLKKNNKNNFYQKYKENKVKLGGIKTYLGKNICSFDNSSNSNIHSNSIGNLNSFLRNSVHYECMYQTPSVENKKLGLYKKVMKPKIQFGKSDKKIGEKDGNNYDTPSAIKVNRSKFLEKVKEKIYDNKKVIIMNNFNSYITHKNF